MAGDLESARLETGVVKDGDRTSRQKVNCQRDVIPDYFPGFPPSQTTLTIAFPLTDIGMISDDEDYGITASLSRGGSLDTRHLRGSRASI